MRPSGVQPDDWLSDPSPPSDVASTSRDVARESRHLAKQLIQYVPMLQGWRTQYGSARKLDKALDALVTALQEYDQSRKRKATQQPAQ